MGAAGVGEPLQNAVYRNDLADRPWPVADSGRHERPELPGGRVAPAPPDGRRDRSGTQGPTHWQNPLGPGLRFACGRDDGFGDHMTESFNLERFRNVATVRRTESATKQKI